MRRLATRLGAHDSGATAAEYVLIVTLIAVVLIAAVYLIGDQLADFFEGVAAAF